MLPKFSKIQCAQCFAHYQRCLGTRQLLTKAEFGYVVYVNHIELEL